MTDTEPVNIRKWMIAAVCFLCVICFGFGIYVGYSINKSSVEHVETKPTVIETEPTEASTSIEKFEEIKNTIETTIETVPETTVEPEPETEPVIEETEYFEPAPTKAFSETISEPVIEETTSVNGMTDLEMLACVIYQEVGGDMHCDECRYRVADVVLNRVASDEFPNTIYEVLTEKGQYGSFYYTGVKWADRANDVYEAEAVDRAWRIAEEVLNGKHSELYGEGYVWQAAHAQGTDGFWCCGHFFGR